MPMDGAAAVRGDNGWWARIEAASRGWSGAALAGAGAVALALNMWSGPTLAFGGVYALIVSASAWLLGFRLTLVLGGAVIGAAAMLNQTALGTDGVDVALALALRGTSLVAGAALIAHVRVRYDRARRSADRDALTGVANHRAFSEAVAAATARAARRGGSLLIAYLDLDDFKRLNDRHGHAVGDATLRAVAEAARAAVRAGDWIGRLGGDEFALLVEAEDDDQAEAALRRIHAMLGVAMPVAFSMGAVIGRPADPAIDLIAAADRLMYRAKRHAKGSLTVARLEEEDERLAA